MLGNESDNESIKTQKSGQEKEMMELETFIESKDVEMENVDSSRLDVLSVEQATILGGIGKEDKMEQEKGDTNQDSFVTTVDKGLNPETVDGTWMLKTFYQRLFPFKEFYKWLSYGSGNGLKVDKSTKELFCES